MNSARADRLSVLYIAGAGRSGSTILERILGNAAGFVSVGEVRFFWEYMAAGDRLCGCGERLGECRFWRGVNQALGLTGAMIGDLARVARSLDRTRNAPFLATGIPASRQFPRGFIESTRRLYQAIGDVAGVPLIVDSSKVPSHLHLLLRIQASEVRVLHLVRDPRAYVYSETRRRKFAPRVGGLSEVMRRRPTGPAAMTWVAENTLCRHWGRKAAAYSLIKYESFAADPDGALERAFRNVGLPRGDWQPLGGSRFVVQPTHSVGGNPLRFDRGPITVAEDKAWMTEMPKTTRGMLGLALWPWLSHYGYGR